MFTLRLKKYFCLKFVNCVKSFMKVCTPNFLPLVKKNKINAFKELIDFQLCSLPKFGKEEYSLKFSCDYNIPEYCATMFSGAPKQLKKKKSQCFFEIPKYKNLHDFTKRQIIWARKSGTILYPLMSQ